MSVQPSAGIPRRGLRSFAVLLVAFLLAATVGVASARPADAFVGPSFTLPASLGAANGITGLISGASGATVTAGTTSAAEIVGGATVATGGVGVVAVAGGLALAAGAGAAVGFAGWKGYGFIKDKFFTVHPEGTGVSGGIINSNIGSVQVTGVDLNNDGVPIGVSVDVIGKVYTEPGTGFCIGFTSVKPGTTDRRELAAGASHGTNCVYTFPPDSPSNVQHFHYGCEYVCRGEVTMYALIPSADPNIGYDIAGAVLYFAPPVWTIQTHLTCQDSAGNERITNSVSPAFGDPLSAPDVIPDALCTAGSHSTHLLIQAVPDRGATVDLVEWNAAPRFTDVTDPQADCMALAGGTQCALDAGTADRPSCTWGANVLADGECVPLRQDTSVVAPPTTQPTPSPTVDPSPAPTPPPGQAGQPVDAEGRDCFPNGWGILNPVEWVQKPVKCALSWAFVPSTSTMTRVDGLATDLTTRAPAPELTSVFSWLAPPKMAGGQCFTVALDLPLFGGRIMAIDSCGDDPFIRWLHSHRSVLTAVVWVACLAPLAGWAWRQYAPGSTGVA
jgi:hypothetical protein